MGLNYVYAKPFLKWAGGKSQLVSQIEKHYPQGLKDRKIKKYVEPFVGGGAVFFDLIKKFEFEKIYLNDINEEIILTYKVIRDNVSDLIKELSRMEDEYSSRSIEEKEKMFYETRTLFNQEKLILNYGTYSLEWIYHASKVIFLNKTCFNGLFRLNKKGEYNVPFGKFKNPTICDAKNLINVNSALQGVTLVNGDFEELTNVMDEDTFVYLDPPYRPLSGTSSFNDYSKAAFDDNSQKRLAKWYTLLDAKNVILILSNSDPTNTNPGDDFFTNLYSRFAIHTVYASRAINSKGNGRGEIRELLITNFYTIPVGEQIIDERDTKQMQNSEFKYLKDKDTFSYFLNNLKDSIKGWDYFVNWNKANKNVKDIEIELNIVNYLIGKDNIKQELKYLLCKHPEVIKVIPILVACREQKFEILAPSQENIFNTETFAFSNCKNFSEEDVEKAVEFVEKTGVLKLFQNKTIKNAVDYVFGIEVGLDSNGRKNRSGTSMEKLVESFLSDICRRNKFDYLAQATSKHIAEKWGYKVTVDKTARSFDFAVNTKEGLFLVETNYYGGGGSKLKATAGEYKTLFDFISEDGHKFIWVTDGKGWLSANRPLEEAFYHNEYIMNLKMLELGVFERILAGNGT